jgi:hypothetical protein
MLNTISIKRTLAGVARRSPVLRRLLQPTYDVYYLSYPKAGRTWLRVMLGKALCLRYGQPDELILRTHRLTAAAGVRSGRFSHEDAIFDGTPYHALSADKSAFRRKRVLLLTRDVRDILVSSYFHAINRTRSFHGTIAEFVRDDAYGARKVVTYYNHWFASRAVPRELVVLRFKDIHRDPAAALRAALSLVGAGDTSPEIVAQAVEFASFENMKKLEAGNYFNDVRMRVGDAANASSAKVRRGKVGGFVDALTPKDIEYIDGVVADIGSPFVVANVGGSAHTQSSSRSQ